MVITLIILAGILVCTSTVAVLVLNRLSKRVKTYETSFARFFNAPDAETASEFGLMVEGIAKIFANELAIKVKASMMGNASVQARNVKAIEGALAMDAVESENPTLGKIMKALPNVADLVKKRPELAGLAQMVMSGIGAGKGNGGGSTVNRYR